MANAAVQPVTAPTSIDALEDNAGAAPSRQSTPVEIEVDSPEGDEAPPLSEILPLWTLVSPLESAASTSEPSLASASSTTLRRGSGVSLGTARAMDRTSAQRPERELSIGPAEMTPSLRDILPPWVVLSAMGFLPTAASKAPGATEPPSAMTGQGPAANEPPTAVTGLEDR